MEIACPTEVEARAVGPEGLGDTLGELLGRMLGHAPLFKTGARLTLAAGLRAAIPVYLESLLWLPGDLPADVRALLPTGSTLPAWDVTVGEYGTGKFALAGLH